MWACFNIRTADRVIDKKYFFDILNPPKKIRYNIKLLYEKVESGLFNQDVQSKYLAENCVNKIAEKITKKCAICGVFLTQNNVKIQDTSCKLFII